MDYLKARDFSTSLFDVPLHYAFYDISVGNRNDLDQVFKDSLVSIFPHHAVLFVDNHDTQKGQSLESWVEPWFRKHADALILLRPEGTPCIFYNDIEDVAIQELIELRLNHRDGDYFEQLDDASCIAWGFKGEEGFVALANIGEAVTKKVYLGLDFVGRQYGDVLIDVDGFGAFYCDEKDIRIYKISQKVDQ